MDLYIFKTTLNPKLGCSQPFKLTNSSSLSSVAVFQRPWEHRKTQRRSDDSTKHSSHGHANCGSVQVNGLFVAFDVGSHSRVRCLKIQKALMFLTEIPSR